MLSAKRMGVRTDRRRRIGIFRTETLPERLLQARSDASLRIVRVEQYHRGGGICFAKPNHRPAFQLCWGPGEDMIDRP